MKTKKITIFRRLSIVFFTLITLLCLLFMAISYFLTTDFHQASTQLLNKEVATHIVEFTSPFEKERINKAKADSVFKNAMILSPGAEIYFLDTTGRVIAFHAPKSEIKLWTIPLKNIKKLIASKGETYIKGPDPKDISDPKIFSAAEVKGKSGNLGFIYVILATNKNVTDVLYLSYLSNLLIIAICIIIVLSIVSTFIYLNQMQRRFNQMIAVLEKFQNGNLEARFEIKDDDELAPVTLAFNKMADMLSDNINRLTRSVKERKDFIINISHELKTPLAIARGYTESLSIKNVNHELSKSEQEEYIQIISDKIQQVDIMVNQLFELSKLDTADFNAAKEPFVLSEIVQETVNNFQWKALQKQAVLKCTQCLYHVWINADVSLMERVVQNLINNAIDNTYEHESIQVFMEVAGNNLIFKLQYKGSLLPQNMLQWLNNSREESTLQADFFTPSGIRFLIVKKILQLHKSSLKAYTDNDRGNVFIFDMPVYNQ
jgi:signal transduction histidine kinase